MSTVMQAPLSVGASFSQSDQIESYPNIISLEAPVGLPDHSTDKPAIFHVDYSKAFSPSAPSTAPSSPSYTTSMSSRDSYFSTPSSNSILDPTDDYSEEDDDSSFPQFEQSTQSTSPIHGRHILTLEEESDSSHTVTNSSSEDVSLSETVNDDQAIEHEPTRHVDYLSHEWREEDIWSSWRYIVSRRKTISNSVRLENASWRTWAKTQNQLKTISPEELNWLKDCDVTWLYGPLQVDCTKSLARGHSPPPSHLSTSSSFIGKAKKPILKKKSASAVILERSRLQHSLLQRAGEIIRVQQSSPVPRRPGLRRGGSDFSLPSYPSSVLNTPAEQDTSATSSARTSFGTSDTSGPCETKHISFNEEVRQVRAIDSEDDKEEIEESEESETDEDDDNGLMMAPARSRSNRSTPRGSFSDSVNTIVPLPPTTLKYRTDTPEPKTPQPSSFGAWAAHKMLSPSPSQETLRPPRNAANFLLDDDPELTDDLWPGQENSYAYSPYNPEQSVSPGPNMRRTDSGMFMPYDENEAEAAMNNTLFGQAMYAVNTFRDIAHVVWNVGWNRNR